MAFLDRITPRGARRATGLWFAMLVLAGLCSCRQSPQLPPGFDQAAFRQDARGCQGKRHSMLAAIDSLRPALHGLTEPQLLQLLGPSDKTDLASRSQRFHLYYLAPGKQCDSTAQAASTSGLRLRVRINAMNTVNEVSILPN